MFELTGAQAFKLLDWLVVVITFHLSMALRVLLRRTTTEKAELYTKIFIAFVIMFNCLELTFMTYIMMVFVSPDSRTWLVSIDQAVVNITLLVIYAMVLGFLIA